MGEQKCGDCAHFNRCNFLFGCEPESTVCDWKPSRWKQNIHREQTQSKPVTSQPSEQPTNKFSVGDVVILLYHGKHKITQASYSNVSKSWGYWLERLTGWWSEESLSKYTDDDSNGTVYQCHCPRCQGVAEDTGAYDGWLSYHCICGAVWRMPREWAKPIPWSDSFTGHIQGALDARD